MRELHSSKIKTEGDLFDYIHNKTPLVYYEVIGYARLKGWSLITVKGEVYSYRVKFTKSPIFLSPMTLLCKYIEDRCQDNSLFKRPFNTFNELKVEYIVGLISTIEKELEIKQSESCQQ